MTVNALRFAGDVRKTTVDTLRFTVDAQKTIVDTPGVKVDAPNTNVDAPGFKVDARNTTVDVPSIKYCGATSANAKGYTRKAPGLRKSSFCALRLGRCGRFRLVGLLELLA